jgi:hypothetical protein
MPGFPTETVGTPTIRGKARRCKNQGARLRVRHDTDGMCEMFPATVPEAAIYRVARSSTESTGLKTRHYKSGRGGNFMSELLKGSPQHLPGQAGPFPSFRINRRRSHPQSAETDDQCRAPGRAPKARWSRPC